MQMQDKEKRRPTSAGRRFSCQNLFKIPRQGHDGRDNGQRGRLTAEDAGAAFLAYLGIRSILKKPKHASLIGRHDEQTESGFSQFMKCAAISAANPQPIIFGLTVLPSFIDPTFSYVFQSAVMIVIYALIVFVMMMAYAILAAHARVFLSGPRGPRVINCISGVVFLFLAAFLLYRALAL